MGHSLCGLGKNLQLVRIRVKIVMHSTLDAHVLGKDFILRLLICN
jgi:hypothetical protein